MAETPAGFESTFWPSFQQAYITTEGEPGIGLDVVAIDVLNTFDIPHNIQNFYDPTAGKLINVDLKRVDPVSAIKASLLEAFAIMEDTALIELNINAEGVAEVYNVGADQTKTLDIYYTISSATFTPPKVSVMVTGGKPMQERIVKPWYPVVGPGAADYFIWDTRFLTSSCMLPGFVSSAVITYKDFLGESGSPTYKDGVPSVFDPETPYETIVGWAWNIVPPSDLMNSAVTIQQNNSSILAALLNSGGTLVTPLNYSKEDPVFSYNKEPWPPLGTLKLRAGMQISSDSDMECFGFGFTESTCDPETTIKVSIPNEAGLFYADYRGTVVSKFKSINSIYFVGIPLTDCKGTPLNGTTTEENPNTSENTAVFISAPSAADSIFRLRPGVDYAISYEDDDANGIPIPCIQFANNCRQNDKATFGTGASFFVDLNSVELLSIFAPEEVGLPEDPITGKGSVFPLNNNGAGILVKQVWLELAVETPCFEISDPRGRADQIAENFKVEVTAIVIKDEPPPEALNGILIDKSVGTQDNDPTTVQDFEKTPYEIALEEVSSGRTHSLSLSSLNEDQTKYLSRALYDIFSADNGLFYTHTCSPDSEPQLGAVGPNGLIINSISYSYSDQSSYLITVVEGPMFFGDFSGIDGGIYEKRVEDVQGKGIIIQDYGNHIDYKIRVDGIGDIMAINGCAAVLDVMDRVNVTIYNNAVEG